MPNNNDSANRSQLGQDTTKCVKNTDKLSAYLSDIINNKKIIRVPRGPLSD